jgi:hypothetical protein
MIGTVYLGVAVHASFVEGEDIEAGYGLKTRQEIEVALLAQMVAALGQQTDVVGTVRRVAGETALLHRCVLPEQWASLLRVTFKTSVVDGAGLEHSATLSAVGIVTGDASHFHNPALSAEQMCRPLEESLSLFRVATETCLLYGEAG